jgi:hypothetical protein
MQGVRARCQYLPRLPLRRQWLNLPSGFWAKMLWNPRALMARPRPFHLQRRRDLETFVPGAPVPDYLQYRAHADTVNRLAHVKLVEEIQIIGCMLFLS